MLHRSPGEEESGRVGGLPSTDSAPAGGWGAANGGSVGSFGAEVGSSPPPRPTSHPHPPQDSGLLPEEFGGCVLEKAEGSSLPTALRCDKGFIGYAKTPGSISGPAKGGTSYEGSFCGPITTTIPKKKEPIVKSFGGESSIVWKSKKLK